MASNGNILLWCQNSILRKNIRHYLKENAYEVLVCKNFEEVQIAIRIAEYRLLITDQPYPSDKYEFLLQKNPELKLFCIDETSHKKPAESGITFCKQPFDLNEITNHLNSDIYIEEPHYSLGEYRVWPSKKTISNKNKVVRIAQKEMELLVILLKKRPDLTSKEYIEQKLWPGETQSHDSSINVYINNLRKYFQDDPHIKIKSVYGKGICIIWDE